MTGEGPVRALSGLLARFGARRSASEELPARLSPAERRESAAVVPTKAFRTFLACLRHSAAPVVMDLGPVVGANVAFFGERLGCKIFVEDLYSDLDRLARQDRWATLPEFFRGRFSQPPASVDGLLCWDVLDYLDRPAARVLAEELTRLLRPGGALLGFFGVAEGERRPGLTKFTVLDETHLRCRWYPGRVAKRPALLTRDIIKMFEGLLVSESFLLKISTREMLFRKPLAAAVDR